MALFRVAPRSRRLSDPASIREVTFDDGRISRISHHCDVVVSRFVGRLLNRVLDIAFARRMFGWMKVMLEIFIAKGRPMHGKAKTGLN